MAYSLIKKATVQILKTNSILFTISYSSELEQNCWFKLTDFLVWNLTKCCSFIINGKKILVTYRWRWFIFHDQHWSFHCLSIQKDLHLQSKMHHTKPRSLFSILSRSLSNDFFAILKVDQQSPQKSNVQNPTTTLPMSPYIWL